MVRAEIIEEIPISMSDLKSELKRIKKRDGELTPRSIKLEDYLNHFNDITKKDHEELTEEINKLNIPRLKEIHVIKIADIIPATIEELKSVLQGYALTVTNDNMKKIIKVTGKFIS